MTITENPPTKQPRKKVNLDSPGPDAVVLNGPVKAPAVALYPVLAQEDFGSYDYVEDGPLRVLASKLISDHKNMGHLKAFTDSVRYYWKRKGGTANGRAVVGKCIKPSGLTHHLADCDFIIWLAADHCQGKTRREVEAILYHELCHIGRNAEGGLYLVPHDVQEFAAVIREYGLFDASLRTFGQAIRQLALEEAD